jgi:hypothetical protein
VVHLVHHSADPGQNRRQLIVWTLIGEAESVEE